MIALALIVQKLDFELADPDYKLHVNHTLFLKPRDLLLYVKPRPHVDTLLL